MKDEETRHAILKMHELGHGYRKIARTLRVSRWFVGEVIQNGSARIPDSMRRSKADGYRERILTELKECEGNLVRVHEELKFSEIDLSYPSLARFVRENHLLKPPKPPHGRYVFGPGEESQFDTSPHDVRFKAGLCRCQCASIILGYSRMVFFRYFPRFTRFECKIFLTEALTFFQGSCRRCIIDNTNLVILHGTGEDAVIVPEMEVFSNRFGFVFQAHSIGDKNRSGKIERPFHYIENNFLVKRVFEDFDDLNRQAEEFCNRNNQSFKRHLKAKPVELYATERLSLTPLPAYIPEVYQLYRRTVDQEGYVYLHTNAYSVPYDLMRRTLDIRETRDQIKILNNHTVVAIHPRFEPGTRKWSTDKSHRPKWGMGKQRQSLPEEKKLMEISDTINRYLTGLKDHSTGRGAMSIKKLYRMYKEYPADSFDKAITAALRFGMFDLNRLENMVLRHIAGDYFRFEMEGSDNE
jgi:transposase